MLQTYHLSWEIIQEFTLPKGHNCCSVDVNEVLGEIMFACRHNGLLHYRWNPHSGLVLATKQPHRVTNYACNCRLVTCCNDGSYLVLNHRQLRYIRLAIHRPQHTQLQVDAAASTIQTTSFYAPDSLTAYSRRVGLDYIEYLDQAVSVGDVRSMVADKQADSIFLLYADRLTRNNLSNLSDSSVFDRCYSLTSELLNVRLSRQFAYLINSSGDIMLRYRSECYDKRDQLYWRTFGMPAFCCPALVDRQAKLNRKLCRSSGRYLELLDSESPVGVLGLAVDSCRQIVFASTGEPILYAVWHPDLEPDLSSAGWNKNWLEDIRISLTEARKGRVCIGNTEKQSENGSNKKMKDKGGAGKKGATGKGGRGRQGEMCDTCASYLKPSSKTEKPSRDVPSNDVFVPAPLAVSTSTASRSGFLYAVDANTGDKVTVLRYTTETTRVG